MEEAVACCVAEELRGWPDFVDATTMKILKDVLAHSKARRFNRFPCRLAWPPIPPLCTYSESNLKYSMRELVNLNTYNLVQDYYRTRFHRQTSIHNFAVDQHGIEQRKLAAAEARCRQQRRTRRMDEMLRQKRHLATTPTASHTRESERLLQKKQDRETQGEGDTHSQRPANHLLQSSHLPCADSKCGHPAMQCHQQQQQDEGHDRHEEQGSAAYEGSATEDGMEHPDVKLSFSAPSLIFDRYTSIRTAPQNELDFFRSVAHDEAIISVAFYHATRGTKLAAFDVLSSQTLLDVRTAFLGCCEAESEPGIPVFPGSCFLIDGILYPDTTHASSGPEYAETIAEHLSGSGKLAKKKRVISSGGGAAASEGFTGSAAFECKATGGEVRIVRPRRRLDGSIRVARPALRQRSTVPSALHEKQQQEHRCTSVPSGSNSGTARESGRNCEASRDVTWYSEVGVIEKNKASGIPNTGGAWDEQNSVASSSTCAALGSAFGEEAEEYEEENDWISIPQHKAVLNDMQLPLRSLECFVHQGTCEHRVIFWNVRQFDPKRDCCYVAAYPVRTYKPSSKAMTCQACEEHLACKGVLNSILCSVHNPTYLCENCYAVLFGGVARGKPRKSMYAQNRCGGGTASQIALSQQDEGARDVAADSKTDGGPDEEEENDDPDPFALHFDVYDG